jgi:hypothetical protein
MSRTLLDAVANQPAAVRINRDWIKQRCKGDFKPDYWGDILKKLGKVQHDTLCVQVATGTPRQPNMRTLLAHGNTQVGKAPTNGGFFGYTANIDDPVTRHFVDALYMLDGEEPSWELFVPFPLQWAGADKEYPSFAAKFTSDHTTKSLPGAQGLCGQRVNFFNTNGMNLPPNLHFIQKDGQLACFHEHVKSKLPTYKAALKELAKRNVVNKGHQINRIWMVSWESLNVYHFTLNPMGTGYNAPAGTVPMYIVFQLQPWENSHYVYHMASAQAGRGYEPGWPWVRKEIKIGNDTIVLFLEYVRP